MDNKAGLIKAITQGNTAAIKAILAEPPPTSIVCFQAAEGGFTCNTGGKVYSLEEIERMSVDNNMISFLPADGLTDEQIEKYLNQ